MNIPANASSTLIIPRVSETDGCGHINNTTLPVWFEAGRRDIFRSVSPHLSFEAWPLAVVTMRVNFLRQIFFHTEVNIATWIARIGTKSFTVEEVALQDGAVCARGECVYVNFDYGEQRSVPIVEETRARLEQFLIAE